MKFFLLAVVVVLFCAVAVNAAPSLQSDVLRNTVNCIEDALDTLVTGARKINGKNPELEKHRTEYKAFAKEINFKLDECEKNKNLNSKKECVNAISMVFSMTKLPELINKLKGVNEELTVIFKNTVKFKCAKGN